jgi:hypothetical protein
MRMKWNYQRGEILSADLLVLFICAYMPLILSQAWPLWFAAIGQSFLIGRRLQ